MNRSHISRGVTLDEELLQIAAQHFANYYDGGVYDPLDPPSPDPLRKAYRSVSKVRQGIAMTIADKAYLNPEDNWSDL